MEPIEDPGQLLRWFGQGLRADPEEAGIEPPSTPVLGARDRSLGKMPLLVHMQPKLSCNET